MEMTIEPVFCVLPKNIKGIVKFTVTMTHDGQSTTKVVDAVIDTKEGNAEPVVYRQ
jgi:hypothetical protein